MHKLTINGQEFEVRDSEQLRTCLVKLEETQFAEVWLESMEGGPSICALVNGNAAWMTYLRHADGDPGFSTRNPAYRRPAEASIEYVLSNGQMDHYPAAWDITTHEALRALEHFLISHDRAPWLSWHED